MHFFLYFCSVIIHEKERSMRKLLLLFVFISIFFACHRPMRVAESRGEIIVIDSTLDAIQDTSYLRYIAPSKAALEAMLSDPIGYAPAGMNVYRPECELLNWACDALLSMARKCYPATVDMAVVNIGGMRCEWAEGDITFRHVFELMPFDNELVVLTMKGEEVLKLCDVMAKLGGEGVAGLRMKARNGKVVEATIGGKKIVPTAYYTVATSDYLSQGNDGLTPLSHYEDHWRSEKKIRDLYIEYIQQTKTVSAKVDGRMDVVL